MIPEGADEEMGAGAMLPPRHKMKTSHMAARHQSLNRGARNQEQKRIMQENDAFLKRL